jgi:hypothetical protein
MTTEQKYGEPGNEMADVMLAHLAKVRADAKELADVRTLDEWALVGDGRWWDIDSDAPGLACVLHDQTPDGDWNFDGGSFAECRAKAAAWVREVKSDTR